MPAYDYKCEKCGEVITRAQSVANRDLPLMCDCGWPMWRVITAPASKLVGAGFHDNDYKKGGGRTTVINREQLAWAAGLFEGEGCFYATGRKNCAQINMVDADVVLRFADIIGFGSLGVIKPAQSHHKEQYRWSVGSFEHFQAFIACVWPWLGERRKAKARELLRAAHVYYRDPNAPRNRGWVRRR